MTASARAVVSRTRRASSFVPHACAYTRARMHTGRDKPGLLSIIYLGPVLGGRLSLQRSARIIDGSNSLDSLATPRGLGFREGEGDRTSILESCYDWHGKSWKPRIHIGLFLKEMILLIHQKYGNSFIAYNVRKKMKNFRREKWICYSRKKRENFTIFRKICIRVLREIYIYICVCMYIFRYGFKSAIQLPPRSLRVTNIFNTIISYVSASAIEC